ncbi:MAG: hypothetical protein J4F42_19175 [Desulfurellaceae bacterium]|nr:hypothetical protein [Desulfurellaceae bacterium]
MSYSDFTFRQLETVLQLRLEEAELYSAVKPVEISGLLSEVLAENVPLALSIHTEKARSELIIAPVLVELRKTLRHQVSIFSGIELNVDPQKGLNGVCDFIIAASSRQLLLSAPLIHIVEAKNENIKSGIPQCVAKMYAAQLFNSAEACELPVVYGVVTTGSSWKFLQLHGEYFIDNIRTIMAILLDMTGPYLKAD